MNPKPFSLTSFLIVPCGICRLPQKNDRNLERSHPPKRRTTLRAMKSPGDAPESREGVTTFRRGNETGTRGPSSRRPHDSPPLPGPTRQENQLVRMVPEGVDRSGGGACRRGGVGQEHGS